LILGVLAMEFFHFMRGFLSSAVLGFYFTENNSKGSEDNELVRNKHLLSGFIREMNELEIPLKTITSGVDYELFNKNSFIPLTPLDKADKILKHIFRKTSFYGEGIDLTQQYAIAYARNSAEFLNLINLLYEMRYISSKNSKGCFLTASGYKKIEELESRNKASKQAFVAMWFNDELKDIYDNYIYKAINEAKFKPLRIDGKEHINKICDEIIAEIRKSRFIVADFTGQRGGVYYEAGFAHGLGIPVIWTCRKKDIDELHFDIRQYNCIIWETGQELYERLKARIEAVIV
jgi:hypothetical protein